MDFLLIFFLFHVDVELLADFLKPLDALGGGGNIVTFVSILVLASIELEDNLFLIVEMIIETHFSKLGSYWNKITEFMLNSFKGHFYFSTQDF